jgi:hypothetical protein
MLSKCRFKGKECNQFWVDMCDCCGLSELKNLDKIVDNGFTKKCKDMLRKERDLQYIEEQKMKQWGKI